MRNGMTARNCTVAIGTMTQAIGARNALAAAAIRTEIVSVEPSRRTRGCGYALSFSCEQEQNLQRVLRSAGIRTHGVSRGGEV